MIRLPRSLKTKCILSWNCLSRSTSIFIELTWTQEKCLSSMIQAEKWRHQTLKSRLLRIRILRGMVKFHLDLKTGRQMTGKAQISRKVKASIHRISLQSIYLNNHKNQLEAKRLNRIGKRVWTSKRSRTLLAPSKKRNWILKIGSKTLR